MKHKEHHQHSKQSSVLCIDMRTATLFANIFRIQITMCTGAVVPLFLKELGAPEVIATSSAGIFSIIIALPMLIIAALTRNSSNTKRLVISVHCIILFVAFIMGYVFTFSDIIKNPNAWKIYFTLFIAYALAIGIIVPIWADFLEKTTNKSLRGKFFGVGFAFNSIGALIGGIAFKNILEKNIQFPISLLISIKF